MRASTRKKREKLERAVLGQAKLWANGVSDSATEALQSAAKALVLHEGAYGSSQVTQVPVFMQGLVDVCADLLGHIDSGESSESSVLILSRMRKVLARVSKK